MPTKKRDKVAVLIPCYNEESTIQNVVSEYKSILPDSTVYVYDNNSDDDTYNVAQNAGAIVRKEEYQGKGNVIRRMFSDIEADVYLVVDGDMTYDSSVAQLMIDKLRNEHLDMVICTRLEVSDKAYRLGHKMGNYFFSSAVGVIFGKKISDVLTGYKVLSRRFVKTFPAHGHGFDIEHEFTVHSLEMRLPISEITTEYFPRPEGSNSKLSTYKDGVKILFSIFKLVFTEKPLISFSLIAFLLLFVGVIWGWFYVVYPWILTGVIEALPSAILATGFIILSFLMFITGLIIQATKKHRKESFRYGYLRYKI
ncbi:glycosyltransferase [Candidatus Woesearchaeota archaeon]|jgi:glycosyltransferase involved in cell wall biosynthesis|nr:glycosyltransferase [Candidatus Woesearchaeota archaeon]